MIVAIQPDTLGSADDRDNSARRWAALLADAGHDVRHVDVFQPDILEQLRGCHGFMWRHAHVSHDRLVAKRLLPVIEHDLGLCVYPDQKTCWHYDDKVAQWYLLQAHDIPIPQTWVFWDEKDAMAFLKDAQYPLVMKLAGGAGSQNVRKIDTAAQAHHWLKKLFSAGVFALGAFGKTRRETIDQKLRSSVKKLLGRETEYWYELHKNYVILQEFLPGNEFDTRVTVIGNRAFAYRRFNRANDFRASGSGNFSPAPGEIDLETVRLAFRLASRLGTQSVAVDGLRRGEDRVVGEISYTYVSWMVQSAPGHWEMQGNPETGKLAWCEGHMWPEEAQIQDFLARLKSRA